MKQQHLTTPRGLLIMMNIAVLAMMMALIQSSHSLPTALSYSVGQEFVYNLHGQVDARGNVQKSNSLTNGTTSTLDSVYAHRCTQILKDGSFVFVANMFNTQVGVGQTTEEARASSARMVNKETRIANVKSSLTLVSGSEPLGYDMYFVQLPTGEITQAYYQDGDSPYFVNVKLSAINAFQTFVTQSTATVLEQDCVGVHTSAYQGTAAAMLNINKQFTQQNFRSFSDAQVTANNVNINAASQTVVHPSGYIFSASTSQITNVVTMQLGAKNKMVSSNSTGFDMNMRSAGSLNLALQSQQIVNVLERVSPINNANFTKGSLFDLAKNTISSMKSINYELPMLAQDPITMIQTILDSTKPFVAHHKDLKKLANYFSSSAPKVVEVLDNAKSTLMKYIKTVKTSNNKQLRDKLFFLLTASKNFEDLFFTEFVESGFDGVDAKIANDLIFHALLSVNTGLKQPSSASVRKTYSLFGKYYDSNAVLRDASLLAFGSLVSRKSIQESIKKDASITLVEMLDRASLLSKSDSSMVVSILGAIYNAESIFAPQDIMVRVAKLMATEKDPRVRSALKMVMRAFGKKYSIPSSKLTFDDSPYPYNRSITKDYNIGGDTISVDLHGDFFIGTNFDCNHPNFNYDGRVEAYANIDVLGIKQASIFDAKAEYGKQGSQLVANQIFLSVFDKVVYQQSLPGQLVDCNLHTYQLYHTSNGFSYDYTVWVSIVPITFSAGATLGLDATWGWQICDAQLSAMVEVIPTAEITVDGKAEIDLLIIKGGVELDASFQAALVPQGYVHGTLCTVGVDVQLQTQPMSANLQAYYAWRDCKYWIVDCHWKQKNEKSLWSWSLPAQQKTLFNEEWKISL